MANIIIDQMKTVAMTMIGELQTALLSVIGAMTALTVTIWGAYRLYHFFKGTGKVPSLGALFSDGKRLHAEAQYRNDAHDFERKRRARQKRAEHYERWASERKNRL